MNISLSFDNIIEPIGTTPYILIHLLITFSAFISMFAGVGGGVIYTPLLVIVCGFDIIQTIPLSITIIFFTSLINVCFFFKKNIIIQNNYRKLINFPILLLIVPFIANSSFIGQYLLNIMPTLITLLCIIIILGIVIINSLKKGILIYKTETIKCNSCNIELHEVQTNEITNQQVSQKIQTGDTTKRIVLYTIIIFISVLIINVFSFTRGFFKTCSRNYDILIVMQIFTCGLIGIFMFIFVKYDNSLKIKKNFIFLPSDIKINNKIIFTFILLGTIVGIIGTYIGVGGAIIINPVMLLYGVPPDVIVATSSLLTCTSTLSGIINYGSNNQILWQYALSFSACGMIGTICGLLMFDTIVNKIKRKSLLVFALCLIAFIGITLLITNTILHGTITNFSVKNICANK